MCVYICVYIYMYMYKNHHVSRITQSSLYSRYTPHRTN